MTTTGGNPIADSKNSLTTRWKRVLFITRLSIQKLAHQNREQIPERVVHAKNWTFWVLEITEDISKYTKQKFYKKVKNKTSFKIFNSCGGKRGAADAEKM